ncbi:globin domain-containing protein [Sneathiella marina]|uniref:Globin domain-containing protein n=1 Tax=Sneathiella marina TaxID=2950108 RepID=A0ABY4W039_9PROT|nr:globin family protein [Sneathiella marina]USG60567.1 globin domain-containing protein [Sneathiella marina]
MTPHQQQLVHESWQQVVPIADTASELFYNRLFELEPGLKPLFCGTDMTGQRHKLIAALTAVVDNLDQVAELAPIIAALGRRHRGYGVEAQHYDVVGQALLDTLKTGLGESWSVELAEAWTTLYGTVAALMQDGANDPVN